tara:strand:+ start:82 stop:291 length:210 start_codon:yes stop_codon:yes gene_type:complete
MKTIELDPNMIAEMYFDAVDLKRTLEENNLTHFNRVHGATHNEDTIGDLIDNLFYNIDKLDDIVQEGTQ